MSIAIWSLLPLLVLLHVYTRPKARHSVPSIGGDGPIDYLKTAIRFITDAEGCIAEGLEQFGGHPFVIPTIGGRLFCIGHENYEAIKMSDDSVFNQPAAIDEQLRLDHNMNSDQQGNPYQLTVVRTDVTRGIAGFISPLLDETILAISEAFKPTAGSTSKSLTTFHDFTYLVARIAGRVMVGKDLCRNDDYEHAIVQFAESIVIKAQLLNWLPAPLRPYAWFLMLSFILDRTVGGPATASKILVPYLEKRVPAILGKHAEATLIGDFLILKAPPHELDDLPRLAMRYMNLSFGFMHTTSITITHALNHLAVLSTEEVQAYRDEITSAIQTDGWTKAGLAKFKRIDSLLREGARFYGLGNLLMGRLIAKDCHLADGTFLPRGVAVAMPAQPIHFNAAVYESPYTFQHDRFYNMRKAEDSDLKYGFTTQDKDFLPFGAGRHACPGRFFASAELRIMLAFIIMRYDISLPAGQTEVPAPMRLNGAVVPDAKAQIVFTARNQTQATDDLFAGFGTTL